MFALRGLERDGEASGKDRQRVRLSVHYAKRMPTRSTTCVGADTAASASQYGLCIRSRFSFWQQRRRIPRELEPVAQADSDDSQGLATLGKANRAAA
jgi:hypothetical protein